MDRPLASEQTIKALGDLAAGARRARDQLDELGAVSTRVVVSGDLDEYRIADLVADDVPIDGFGVGTRLVAGAGAGWRQAARSIVDRGGGRAGDVDRGRVEEELAAVERRRVEIEVTGAALHRALRLGGDNRLGGNDVSRDRLGCGDVRRDDGLGRHRVDLRYGRATDGVLEASQPIAQRATHLRQALSAEHEKHDQKQEGEVDGVIKTHGGSPI